MGKSLESKFFSRKETKDVVGKKLETFSYYFSLVNQLYTGKGKVI